MVKDVFIRKIQGKTYYRSSEVGNGLRKIKRGMVISIPENYIGGYCLVVPITSSQKQMFHGLGGTMRRKRFVEQIMRNPIGMIDKYTKLSQKDTTTPVKEEK